MDSYKSNVVTVPYSAELVYSKLSNPQVLQARYESLPAEVKEKLHGVTFSEDAISFEVPPVGAFRLVYTVREPNKLLRLEPEASPVPFMLNVYFEENGATCNLQVELSAELNPFIKAMVGSKLGEGAKKFGDMLAAIPFDLL